MGSGLIGPVIQGGLSFCCSMPCTFSHPLAVLPFRRFCPERLNFTALMIGSLSPDFAYYVRQFPIARFAHTILGTVVVCLPTGLVLLAIFYLIRRPLCFLLPQPHRAALMPFTEGPLDIGIRGFLVAAVSLLIGAWSHTIWDSFTHEGAWSVRQFAFLRYPILQVGDIDLPVSYVLQQISTIGGGVGLAVFYVSWLRRQPAAPPARDRCSGDNWRYLLLLALVGIALAIGAPPALRMASLFEGYTAFRVFVFRIGVYAAAAFIPLLALASCIVYAVRRKWEGYRL
jgi:hypothetical protein